MMVKNPFEPSWMSKCALGFHFALRSSLEVHVHGPDSNEFSYEHISFHVFDSGIDASWWKLDPWSFLRFGNACAGFGCWKIGCCH
jgi:hypothetical protein